MIINTIRTGLCNLALLTFVMGLLGCGNPPAGTSQNNDSPLKPTAEAALKKKIWKVSHSRRQLQSLIEFLSSDFLEGRAPGTRGGLLAEEYTKSLFKLWDIPSGVPADYLQPFPVNGFVARDLTLDLGGEELKHGTDTMGAVLSKENISELEADAVFVGFGITTAIWEWDDFKDIDVKNKIVIARLNDPGMFNPKIFEGKVLTYFGRWTYHIEEAIRRGASGILLIHTDETAGYGWPVVENSWSGEKVRLDEQIDNNLKLRAWVKEASLKRALHAKGIDLDELYRASLSRDFRPIPLGFKIRAQSRIETRRFEANNVVGLIPGKSERQIVLSAHIDHLGVGKPENTDNIYNGAIDNGSALASMMLVARYLADHREELFFSILLLACNAEEGGLLGSRFFVSQADKSKIVANINFESTPVWEKAGSLMGIGARFSTFEDLIREVAREQDLQYSEFSLSNQGLFYRSDQFPFASSGIPAVWISAGEDDASQKKKYTAFWSGDYHTVRDEYDPEWKLESMEQTINAALRMVQLINERQKGPTWKGTVTFPFRDAGNEL